MVIRRKSSNSLLGIILCIPLAFIVYFAISYSSHNISPDSISSVSMTLPDGKQYTYSDTEQVEYFVNALLDAKSISSPVRDIEGETPVTMQYDRGDKILSFKFYPQANLTGCMIVNPDGKMFIMTSDTASEILVRPELQYVYKDSLLPTLSVVSDNDRLNIQPTDYKWYFKKVDGNFYTDRVSEIYNTESSPVNSIYPDSNSKFEFSVEPSDLSISYLTSDGDILSISDLSYLSFERDTEILVSINAKWDDTGNCDYYGEATYTFPLLYDIPAAITLEKKEFDPGEFAILTINHLNENEQVLVETQLENNQIMCFKEEDVSFALLPISRNIAAGEYSVDFKVGGAEYTETVTVNPIEPNHSILSVSDKVYEEMLSPEIIAQTSNRFTEVFSNPTSEKYYPFGEEFIKPVSGKVTAEFGKEVIISTDATTHRVNGIVYSVKESTAVKAAQRGRIVFAESIGATGNTIIIDHGYGIMSCYYNLKSFERNIGDIVQQGERIALSGATGYTGGESILNFAVSVNGIFVNPERFYKPITIPH